jgi:hypothetical protein
MDSRKIEELLTKYWECESSLEEEKQLREYFEGNNLAEQHKEVAALFLYFGQNKKKSIDDQKFDRQLLHNAQKKQGKVIAIFYNSMRIAAGIAVLIVAIWFVRSEIRKNDPVAMQDTYKDPKIAFEETKKALMMISKGFTQAETQAKKINLFNEAREEIQKTDSNKSQL